MGAKLPLRAARWSDRRATRQRKQLDPRMNQVIRFDPTACRFPPPRIPILPGASIRAWRQRRTPAAQPRGEASWRHVHFKRARYALRAAYQLAGVGPGTAVLVPSYHCRTMLDAAVDLGAELRFYRVDAALHPDVDDITRCVASAARPVRAVLLTHYFGFAQDAGVFAALCRRHGVELIEDCSHAMVLDPALSANAWCEDGIGQTGSIGVSSPYKFLPGIDGGLLWFDRGRSLEGVMQRPGWIEESRALIALASELRQGARRESSVAPVAPVPVPADVLPAEQGVEVIESGDGL